MKKTTLMTFVILCSLMVGEVSLTLLLMCLLVAGTLIERLLDDEDRRSLKESRTPFYTAFKGHKRAALPLEGKAEVRP